MKLPVEIQQFVNQRDVVGYRDYCFEWHGLVARTIAERHLISLEDTVEIFTDVVEDTFSRLLRGDEIMTDFSLYFEGFMDRACELSDKNPYQYVFKTCYAQARGMINKMEGGEYFYADDVLQDSLLALIGELKKKREPIKKLKGYYFTIVRTRYFETKRKQSKIDKSVDLNNPDSVGTENETLVVDAEEELEDVSLYKKVRDSARLSEACKEFIDLFFDRGVLLKDIAGILLVTAGRVSQIKTGCLDEVQSILVKITQSE